jgi:subfamily B ATP-binding cassette protein MsbA
MQQVPSSTILPRLWQDYVHAHKGRFGLAFICMVLVAGTTALNAWMMQPVLDDIFLNQKRDMLLVLPLIVVALAIVKAFASYGQAVIMRFIGQRVISDMQKQLYAHLIHADLALFHSQSSGSLLSRFTNDVVLLREAVSSVLTGFAKEALTLIFLIGVMCYQNIMLAMIAMLVFPVAIYPIQRLGKRMRKISGRTQEELGRFTTHLDESFQGIRMIKAQAQETRESDKANDSIENVFAQYIKAFRVKSAASPMMELLAGLAIAAIIYYGGLQVMQGETTPGAFFSFIAAMIMAYKPMKSMAGLNTNLQEGLAAAARVYSILDTPPTILESDNAHPLNVSKGHISIRDLTFRYTSDRSALQNVTLDIPAGTTVALVGPSGSGKSSLMNLILRFYDPENGQITIDAQDLRHVTLQSLRANIALVTQETILFDDTVRANICYGMPEVDEDTMINAARDAEAHHFIMELPDGYDTPIGQHGVTLSGGQRQRLAIARAMLKNAPILLLDEATSALDPIAEKHIQEALKRLMKGRTTLMVAHRLSTIVDADVIYVLQDGQIVESGTHASLLEAQGTYHALYHQQGL